MHVLIEAKYHKGHKDEALDQALEFKDCGLRLFGLFSPFVWQPDLLKD